MAGNLTRVVMGAGKWYIAPWTGGALDAAEVAVPGNLMGYTQGGAALQYTPQTYDIEDDAGMVKRTFLVKAGAEMKTGLLTFDLNSLNALMSVGQVTLDAQKRTMKLGGGPCDLRKFCVVFVYEDENGKKTRVGMIATNTAPLKLAFAKDKETVVDITFTAGSNGVDDTILVIEEEI